MGAEGRLVGGELEDQSSVPTSAADLLQNLEWIIYALNASVPLCVICLPHKL